MMQVVSLSNREKRLDTWKCEATGVEWDRGEGRWWGSQQSHKDIVDGQTWILNVSSLCHSMMDPALDNPVIDLRIFTESL